MTLKIDKCGVERGVERGVRSDKHTDIVTLKNCRCSLKYCT